MTNNPDAVIILCPACSGYGAFEEVEYDDDDQPYDVSELCDTCNGYGEIELGDSAAFL